MSTEMSRIWGIKNAYEFSETLTASSTGNVTGSEKLVSANVGQLTLGIKRTSGSGGYKMQVSYSTQTEVNDGDGVWFDWEVTEADENGFVYDDTYQHWMPIPSHFRFVVETASDGTEVYFSVRAN